MGNIDWNKFDGQFITFEEAEPRALVMTNWKVVLKEFRGETKDGIELDVLELDGKKLEKTQTLSTTSKRLIGALKPFIVAAEEKEESIVRVKITRIGKEFDTQYSVKQLEATEE